MRTVLVLVAERPSLHIQFFADLPDDRSYPIPQGSLQHLIAILRNPDDVIAMVKNSVTPAGVAL
jgi:hypothetical protein